MIEWTRGAATTRKSNLDGTIASPRKLNLGGTVEALVRKRGVNRSAFGRCAYGLSVERAELLCDALRIFRNQIPFGDVYVKLLHGLLQCGVSDAVGDQLLDHRPQHPADRDGELAFEFLRQHLNRLRASGSGLRQESS